MVTVCPSQFATRRTLFQDRKSGSAGMPRSEERFSRNAETDLVCRLLLEKKKQIAPARRPVPLRARRRDPPPLGHHAAAPARPARQTHAAARRRAGTPAST